MLPEGMDRTRLPGDDDLVALACRRTTFEWVLRRTVLAEPPVTLLDGHTVAALTWDEGSPPLVTGVLLDDGRRLDADLVVAAGGRRCDVVGLLEPLGVDLEEHTEDTGIIYFSRFFRLHDGADYPTQTGPIGGDLGYLKYGVFPGDNRTFSITLAVGTGDDELRKVVLDPRRFLEVAGRLPATAPYVDGRAQPITDVFVMARLLNRRRRFTTADGAPKVSGFSAVGDAHTCTNPLYGRGCSLAFVQAELLAASIGAHPGGPVEQAAPTRVVARSRYSPGTRLRWRRTPPIGADASAPDAAPAAGTEPGPSAVPVADPNPMRAMMRDGLLPAMRTDPVVLRAFLRMFNLLEAPDSLMKDWDVIGRVMAVYQDRDQRPPEPSLGPDRAAMLAR